jgi:hypothetical protein
VQEASGKWFLASSANYGVHFFYARSDTCIHTCTHTHTHTHLEVHLQRLRRQGHEGSAISKQGSRNFKIPYVHGSTAPPEKINILWPSAPPKNENISFVLQPPPPRWNFPTGATGAGRAGAGAGVAGAGTGAGGAGAGGQGVLGRLPDHSSLIYIRCVYDIFGREITEYTAIHGAYIRFWLTLHIRVHTIHGLIPLTIILYTYL